MHCELRTPMRHQSLLVFGAVIVACNSSPPPAAAPQALALPDCTKAWWFDNTVRTCADYCQPQTPECTQSDCTVRAALGFTMNGELINAFVKYSAASSTLSSSGQPAVQTFQVVGDGIKTTPPGTIISAKCSTSGLSIGYADYVRPSSAISAALDKAQASGATSWVGIPVQK